MQRELANLSFTSRPALVSITSSRYASFLFNSDTVRLDHRFDARRFSQLCLHSPKLDSPFTPFTASNHRTEDLRPIPHSHNFLRPLPVSSSVPT